MFLMEGLPPQLPFPLTILNSKSLFIFQIITTCIITFRHSTISMMKVFAGTYQGNVFFLQGTPNELKIKSVQPVSENSLRSMTLSYDELIVGGYDQEIRALHPSSGVEAKESKESKGVINCIRNIDTKSVVLGLDDGTIRFWDKTSWSSRKDIRQHRKPVTDIKIGKNGMMMVSVAGREMIFWNISNLKSLYHFRFDFDIEHVLLVDSFEYLFLLSDKTVRQIDTEDNKELFKFTINDKIQCGLVFLNYLIVATEKGEIKVWNHGHYEFCIHFKAHDLRVKDMKHVAVEDGNFLVTADSNGVIRVWDILQFLKGVDSISQDYDLEGLKPLCSVETKQRVICIEVQGNQPENTEDQVEASLQAVEQEEQQVVQKSHKKKNKNKQKAIQKPQKKGKKALKKKN